MNNPKLTVKDLIVGLLDCPMDADVMIPDYHSGHNVTPNHLEQIGGEDDTFGPFVILSHEREEEI